MSLKIYTTDGLSSSTLTDDALEDGLGELDVGGMLDGDGDWAGWWWAAL